MTRPRWSALRAAAPSLCAAILLGACSQPIPSEAASRPGAASEAPPATPQAAGPSPPDASAGGSPAAGGSAAPAALPPNLPAPPEAEAAPDAVDPPAVVAAWRVPGFDHDAYGFYLEALPAAGFTIDAAHPGGAAAIIRFSAPDGSAWQLDLVGFNPTRISLGPPHP